MAVGSSSKIQRWRRCKKKAWYVDVKKLRRKVQSVAPRRGTVLHKALEEHVHGRDWTKPIQEMTIDLDNVFDEERAEWVRVQGDMYKIMRGYLRHYSGRDRDVEIIATELQFDIEIGGHRYTGTIDLIYRDKTGLWLRDYKTVKRIPPPEELYMDHQTFMYFKAAESLGYSPTGVEFDHIRTKVPTIPQPLKNGGLSRDKSIDTDVTTYFDAVKALGLNPDDYADMVDKLKDNVFYRRIRIPVKQHTVKVLSAETSATLDDVDRLLGLAKSLGDDAEDLFPRTVLKDRCGWDCEFYPLCFASLAGMDTSGILEDQYEERDERYDDEKESD